MRDRRFHRSFKAAVYGVAGVFLALTIFAGPPAGAASKPRVLKLAFLMPPSHPEFQVNDLFAKRLEELSGGRVKVEIYHSGVLGDEREVLEQAQVGSIDFARTGCSVLSGVSRGYLLPDLPFVFSGPDNMLEIVTSEQWKGLVEAPLVKKGIKPIAHFWGGGRDLYTKRPVASLGDLKGMKIRTTESPTVILAWKAFGAIPTPISFSELYTSLQTGIVDGSEGSPVTYLANRLNEVAPCLCGIQYQQQYTPFFISLKTWQSLAPDLQNAVLKAGEEATQKCKAVFLDQTAKIYKAAEAKGVKVTKPADLPEWRKRGRSIYNEVTPKVGPDGAKMIQWILSREK